MLTSDTLRLQLCALFRRAAQVRSPQAFLVQLFQFLRDELDRPSA